tara:strand:+ start:921 stop:1733 length:813 start_codon:yes stop_codon:yes gene_type:complete
VAEDKGFPSRSLVSRGSVLDVRDTIARPSLDTFFEVEFSFGKMDRWLKGQLPGKKRTQGYGFKKKMSLLCTQAELPGTSYVTSTAIGHRQGIQEEFPNLRNFPPLNLVFYCDADQVIIQVLESWMSYINPIATSNDEAEAFSRFNYPDDYKETIHITKFERDSFIKKSTSSSYESHFTQFEFVNVWPSNLTSMRVAYGDSNVLRCNVQFAYDRFFTSYTQKGDHKYAVLNTPNDVINSNEQALRTSTKRVPGGQGGLPLGTTTNRQGGLY